MKTLVLNGVSSPQRAPFQIHRLGLHEVMRAGLVDRPGGTGDYLFMLFHSPVQIQSSGRIQEWPMSSLMIWTPEDGHYYGNTQLNWDHSWLHAAGRDIPTILKKARLPVGKPFQLSAPSLMERYLLETVAELKAWGKPDATILRNQFENMVRMLARSLFDQPKQLAPAHLLELKSYIEEHFTEGLNLPALARRAGWSVPHLCTEFKRFFGISIIQYVQQLRLNQAAYLLRDHNWRVSEIASQVGYADLYTFSKMFKRSLGISPRGFRQRNIP